MAVTASTMLRRLLVLLAHLLSVVVYSAYEVFVRVVNRRARPLSPRLREVVLPFVDGFELDIAHVRMRAPAFVPSGPSGLTLGRRIFLTREPDADSPDDMALLIHELVHVEQRVRYGRLAMMHRYGVEWARRLSYRDHPMEIEAREAQHAAHADLMANAGGHIEPSS